VCVGLLFKQLIDSRSTLHAYIHRLFSRRNTSLPATENKSTPRNVKMWYKYCFSLLTKIYLYFEIDFTIL